MCKLFFYSKLMIACLLIVLCIPVTGQQDLFQSRELLMKEALAERLYHEVVDQIQGGDMPIPEHVIDKNLAIGMLHTRYPELTYQLERLPKQTLQHKEIAELMVEILKTEVAAGVADSGDSFWHLTTMTEMKEEDRANFRFLYAYELFKQKRFEEADKIFSKIGDARKGEFEYAYYYSGLTALLDQDYHRAEEQLKHIGINEKLKHQTPYYLAASHYGQKDYHTIVNYYQPRISDIDLHNLPGLIKIVGYSQFKLEKFDEAIVSLTKLEKYTELSDEEKYVLGIAYQKVGDRDNSTKLLAGITIKENNLSGRAQYEKALNLAETGDTDGAIKVFEQFLINNQFDKNDILWNLCILQGRNENYDKVAHHAIQLINGPKKKEATQLMAKLLDNIENEELFRRIATELSSKIEKNDFVKNAIYNRATFALKYNDHQKAERYFDLMVQLDPIVEERGSVAAWRGIMAYLDNNFAKAIRLLSNYEQSLPADHISTSLDFDVAYFLAYSNFKLKNHTNALGHFSQALSLHHKVGKEESNDFATKEDDIFLRLGDCYFLLNEHKSAQQAYTRVIDRNGKDKDYALWQNAIIAELDGRPYDQIIILDEIVSEYPQSKYYHRALYSTANSLFGLQKYDKASQFYNRIIASQSPQPMKEESYVQLGLINVNAGDYAKAETYFQKLIHSSENNDIVERSELALKEIYADYTHDTDAYINLVASENDNASDETLAGEIYQLGMNNYEKGNKKEALEQWQKLINEYSSFSEISTVYARVAKLYEEDQSWNKAIDSYLLAAQNTDKERSHLNLVQAERLAYSKMKDFEKFQEIRKYRISKTGNLQLSDTEIYQSIYASLELKQLEIPNNDLTKVFASTEIVKKDKLKLLEKHTTLHMLKKDYESIIQLYINDHVDRLADTQPKLIYQRALVYFNAEQLEKSEHAITDHYDALLENPAWLAKGIILVADIFVLKDDKDSAEAALEALISSQSKIPDSLITIAKERLKSLELQN